MILKKENAAEIAPSADKNGISKQTYTLVTLAYWAFMLSDGALRMVVLLHFHALGYTTLQLAFLFLLYEFAGILTNLFGGWIGARFGLRKTLFLGLACQVFALLGLGLVDASWTAALTVVYVMLVQALAGVAKDLTKMSSKSSVKLLIPKTKKNADAALFFWVAFLTGLKNALKGAGFFLGGLLLSVLAYQQALYALAAMLFAVLLLCLFVVRSDFGKSKSKPKFRQLFSKSSAINRLSFARAFLFASRDVWFVVALPVFLHTQLDWSFEKVGAFMACWVIGYGFVQAAAPKIARATTGLSAALRAARVWGFLLVLVCASMPLLFLTDFSEAVILLFGLAMFGFVFAINSSVHSYLILAYTSDDEVALNVGFYYMANAVGRLVGTLLSGLMYLWGGLVACLWTATFLCLVSAAVSLFFPSLRRQGD